MFLSRYSAPLIAALIWLLLLSPCAVTAQQHFPIGTKNRFVCVVDVVGIATLIQFKRNGPVEGSLIALKKTARRRRRALRSNLAATRSSRSRRRGRLRSRVVEWRRVIADTRACIARNDMTVACSIFGGDETDDFSGPYIPRIIDGARCTRGDSPVVEIRMYDYFGDSLGTCSGVALNDQTVLTAAHCFANNAGKLIAAYADVFTGSSAVRSNALFVHPDYDGRNQVLESHDIAIVRTAGALNTQHLSLHTTNDLSRGELVATAGFGLTEDASTDGLRGGFMKILRTTTESIEARFMPGSGSNTCNGDSGGPLAVKRGNQWFVAGVTSNGDNWTCGRNGKQDISRWANSTSPSNLGFIESHAPELFAQ